MTVTEGPYQERHATVFEAPIAAPAAPVDAPVLVSTSPVVGQVRRTYNSRSAPDAIIAALIGLVLLVVGLIAITRGGFDGPMSAPVVKVLGFTHTTTLGLLEIGIGLLLLIAGATRSRGGELFFGSVLGIAGFVGAVQTSSFEKSLALESSMAWLSVIAGVVVALSALLMPRFTNRTTAITRA